MQILCKASNTASDVRCKVCGQGFLVYWTGNAPTEREHRRQEVVNALRAHHLADESAAAHPVADFHVPVWESDTRSPAALLGEVPALAAA